MPSRFTAASESFNQKNIRASIAESIERFRPVTEAASMPVRGYVSTAFHCPYEGRVDPAAVIPVVQQLADLGITEVSIGDTIGKASPADVRALCDVLLPAAQASSTAIAMHFHDTRGTAIANVCAALEGGVTIFDSASGGLGGCPYAPGASGNLATEDLLYLMGRLGIETGVSIDQVGVAARFIQEKIGRALPGRMIQAHNACLRKGGASS